MFWNEEIETMSRPDLEELQLKKLQSTVKRAFDKIPYYNKKYSEAEVYPEDIETLKDIEKLPFITKDDLRESYPFGLFAVDIKNIKELHSSSGTTGKPVVSGYTEKDLDTWAETIARGLTMMGLDEGDILQNTHGYGMFTGGFGVHYGCHKIGAAIIPISTGQTRRQIEIMEDFGTTGLIFTPSYGIHLGEVALEDGIDPKDLGREYEEIIRINAQSGKAGAAWILEKDFGVVLPKGMQADIGLAVKTRADSLQRELSSEEVYNVFKEGWLNTDSSLKILDVAETHLDSASEKDNVLCRASVSYLGETYSVGAKGNGPLAAFVEALQQTPVPKFSLSAFHEHAIGSGSDTDAMAYVELTFENGEKTWGSGKSSNIGRAGIKAIVSAVNRLN